MLIHTHSHHFTLANTYQHHAVCNHAPQPVCNSVCMCTCMCMCVMLCMVCCGVVCCVPYEHAAAVSHPLLHDLTSTPHTHTPHDKEGRAGQGRAVDGKSSMNVCLYVWCCHPVCVCGASCPPLPSPLPLSFKSPPLLPCLGFCLLPAPRKGREEQGRAGGGRGGQGRLLRTLLNITSQQTHQHTPRYRHTYSHSSAH